jgi:hypothetical protein
MDTLVNHAQLDKDQTQETKNNVLMLQDVTLETKSLVLVILKAAMLVEHALLHKSQDKTDLNATDQDQLADVLRNTLLMDSAAFHAQLDKYLTKTDNNATQLMSAMDQEKSLVLLKTAMHAELAHQTLSQTPPEEHVLDQSQFAHALKDTLQMVMNAKNAQPDKLLIKTTTRDAYQRYAATETRSSHQKTTAGNASNAHKDTSQTQLEASASESSQLAVALRSMTLVVMFVSHAHHIKLLPTETKDVSQDNAQDSTKSSVLLINAMPANNAKRDLPQIT